LAVIDHALPDGTALDLLPLFNELESHFPVIVLTGNGTIELAVETIKRGAKQFLTKPIGLPTLLWIVQKELERSLASPAPKSRRVRPPVLQLPRNPFIGVSGTIKALEQRALVVRAADCSILIQGETGVGKGVLARWLHSRSKRAGEAIVDLNCAGLSRELLESELFGYERGAFTGASRTKIGLIEVANRGTLFLDEIGDMDLQIQAKLLKVLEEGMFRRLGDVRDRCSNFRLITATHHDVSALVREKRFRSDLYFRINTVVLRVPSLRERREDIPVIAEELLSDLSVSVGRPRLRISERGMDALLRHSWPGNIRELRNALESAVLLSESDVLDTFFFDSDVIPFSTSQSADSSASENAEFLTLEEVEIKHILSVLSSVNGNVVLAATRLNIGKTTLYRRLKQLHISAANIA